MEIVEHKIKDVKIAELISAELIIGNSTDGIDLLGNLYYQGFDSIIIYEKNISHEFFDLKTGIAGEVLQKFSTYRVRLAIVGDFTKYTSKSLADFIFECNNGKHVSFVVSTLEALKSLAVE